MSEKSVVEGDIKCDRLDLNGSVSGDSLVNSSTSLGREAVIYGNITTQNLAIQEGAIINGAVKVNKQKAAEDDNKSGTDSSSSYSDIYSS